MCVCVCVCILTSGVQGIKDTILTYMLLFLLIHAKRMGVPVEGGDGDFFVSERNW